MKYTIPRPSGFVVDEIPGVYVKGDCTHFTLKKTLWNTLDVIKELARLLHVNVERFGYAGLKDKNAVTTQRLSAWRIPSKRLSVLRINGVELSEFREGLEKIKLGSHQGNHFRITIEGVKSRELITPFNVPNFFGVQRFGGNELFGKALIERDWKGAVELLHDSDKKFASYYLRDNPNDFLGALRKFDKRVRVLWINAFQSMEWNDKVKALINNSKLPCSLMLTSYPEIPLMPELGCFPGVARDVLMTVKDYKVIELSNGVILEFSLPNGSYATTLIDFVTDNL